MKPRAEAAVLVQPEVEARVPPFKAVSRKGVLAIAAVIDVAISASARPVSAKALAARHRLPPRHLEPVLQALVRDDILKGIPGPHGGYALARESNRITADDILRAARTAEDELPLPGSTLVHDVVRPALAETERTVSVALGRINIDDMVKRAKTLR
ncbi:MAG: Rrf2 family transcriptional regulator [Pseudolabrys sp.]|jgi:Rrf2 family iron-sulfur cluster assembly transcriptional regulator